MPRAAPLVAAVALLAVVGVVGAIGLVTRDDASADARSGARTGAATGASVTTPTTSTTLAPTTTTTPKSTIDGRLKRGMSGPEVQALQQRLADMSFQPGPVDGQFGELTKMAVWAYQKLVTGVAFDQPDGIVTPEMWLALQDPLPVHARRPEAGRHTEVYLTKQVVVMFDGDVPMFISHASSGALADPPGNDFGKGEEWSAEVTIDPGELGNEKGTEPLKKGLIGNAWTPSGVYKINRKFEGNRESRLGGMLNPVYFNYGIAIHGAFQVPLHPASHGCIRIPNLISPTFFNLTEKGQQVYVFDDKEEPEEYGSPPGFFDLPDPDYTTTTTTVTTTMSTTTAAATTTTATAATAAATTTSAVAPPATRAVAPPATDAPTPTPTPTPRPTKKTTTTTTTTKTTKPTEPPPVVTPAATTTTVPATPPPTG